MNRRAQHVDDPLHAWAVLCDRASARRQAARADFAARRAKLAAQFRQQLADEQPRASAFADFRRRRACGDWQAIGRGFRRCRREAARLGCSLSPAGRVPGRLLGGSAAHSGLLSAKLQGVLRSPTFEITKPKIFYRLYGSGGHVRLIVDGLQLIKDPIYGGLQFEPGVDRAALARAGRQQVDRPSGLHRAGRRWRRLSGARTGRVRRRRRARAQTESAGRGDARRPVAGDRPSAGREIPGTVRRGRLRAGSTMPRRSRPTRRTGPRSSTRSWRSRWLDAASLDSPVATFKRGWPSSTSSEQQIEGQIAPPRQAMALADGTAENEHVFIRGSHKTLGRGSAAAISGSAGRQAIHAPPEQGSGRLELARQIASPDNPLVAARDGQPALAASFRRGHRPLARRFWRDGPAADASRAARLPGRRARARAAGRSSRCTG